MNGEYFLNPTFPINGEESNELNQDIKINDNNSFMDFLRTNINKKIKIYTKFNKELEGNLKILSEDYLLIDNTHVYLIKMSNIGYIEFETLNKQN